MGLNIRLIGLIGLVLSIACTTAAVAPAVLSSNGSIVMGRIIHNCSRNEFKCSIDNKCIPLLKVQDGTVDCIDGSDEGIHIIFSSLIIIPKIIQISIQ